ncbi:uncharacterized protein LOC117321125 [Pecten maximus]|uniref:uncharacterized protein LOC117321125 n=1 Tax=Pecten maximus TaxID=6579 RepID=UPI001458CBB9|nr:uncharacterized protein LOC117321125 [Pecten maximus]
MFESESESILELPLAKKTPRGLKSLAIKCREKLSILHNATYLCQKEETLTSLVDVLDHEIIKVNSGLYINHGLCEETPAKKSEVKSKPEKRQPIHNKLKLVKTRKRKERSAKRKPAPDTSETIIIDGIVALDHHKEFQEGIADMVSTMSASEWDALVQDAKCTSTYQFAMDMVARTALTMLDEICPNGDHVDILHSLSHTHSPSELNAAQQLRLSLILLATYVKEGKYHLQRDFAKEEAEASKAMMECIAAMKSLAETNSASASQNSQGTKRKSEDAEFIEQPSAAAKKSFHIDEKKSNVKTVKVKEKED